MDYIIRRSEAGEVSSKNYWILVYGRRKVGKTFLLRNLCKFDKFYTVKKDLSITSDNGQVTSDFIHEIKSLLGQNKSVVIDEFQRLAEGKIDELPLLHPKGKIVLSGSSMRIVKKIFEPKSSLLGFFTPIKIGFIKPSDIISGLKGKCKNDEVIELAAFLREPWMIPLYNREKVSEFVYTVLAKAKYTITALIGEIFTEEERELTKKYEAILNLIGSGVWNTRELTSILYSRNLIPDPSPNHLIQYLKNLEEMDLVESIKLHRSKRRFYRLASPVMNIYYYLDSRYDISSRSISFGEVKATLEKLINFEIQNFVADLFAGLYGGRKEYFVSPQKEIDFIITKRNKPEIIGEVKWKKISMRDIQKFKKNSERLQGRRIMVCKSGEAKESGIEILDPKGLISLAETKRGKNKA